jgi:hypothetical protein
VHSSFVIVKRNFRDRRLRSLRIGGPDQVSERNSDLDEAAGAADAAACSRIGSCGGLR